MISNEIRIEFQYTEAEYLAACRLHMFRNSETLFRLILFFVFILAGALLLTTLVTDFPWWTTLTGTLFVEAFILYNALVMAPRHYFRGDGRFRDQYEVSCSDEGIRIKTKQIDSQLGWALYTKVIEGRDLYLLVYGKGLPMMTTIPKRAFQSAAQESAFRELLQRHIHEHSTPVSLKKSPKKEGEYKPSSLNPPDWR